MPFINILGKAILLCLFSLVAIGHGVTSTTAKLEVRPNNLVELNVQFDFIELLNHKSIKYSLPQIASLKPETFSVLYQEVIKLFNKQLIITHGDKLVATNKRYPSAEQVLKLLKRELIEVNFSSSKQDIPYTFSDRRFYQQFYFDFRLNSVHDLSQLQVVFPKELGNVYVTISQSNTRELHKAEIWRPKQSYSHH